MSAARTARIDFLEGIRGVLAIWVMFCHVGEFLGLSRLKATDPIQPGWLADIIARFNVSSAEAVAVFMSLSGFVIFYLIDTGKEAYLPYLIRRFLRLWPVFIICIAIGVVTNGTYVAILANNPWSANTWIVKQHAIASVIEANKAPYIAWDVLMLHTAVPASVLPYAGSAFSSLAWCISTEWQFYLVAPLLFVVMRRRLGVAAVSVAVLFCMVRPDIFAWAVNPIAALLPLQIRWFFLGLASYLAYRGVQREGFTREMILAIVGVAGFAMLRRNFGLAGPIWLLCFGLLLQSAAGYQKGVGAICTRILASQPFRYFGRISYPIYLCHWPICILLVRLLIELRPSMSWQAAYIVLMIGVPAICWPVAHVMHHWIEIPTIELGRRLASRFGASRGSFTPSVT